MDPRDETNNVKDVEYQLVKNPRKGGYRATYFIFAMMLLDNIGFVANMVSLVLYFGSVMYFDIAGSATATTNFLGTTFLLTIVGGFISDTYLSRLNTCILFGIIQLSGYALIVIQSHDKKLQPGGPCGERSCVHGTKAFLFYSSIYLLALGGGGMRGCVPALGADQFDDKKPKERAQLASFFNWFLFSITIGASIGVTFVVYVSTRVKWYKGFIISLSCSAAGLVIIALGKPFYRTRVPGESPFIRVLQVLVAAAKNLRVQVPHNSDELYEIQRHSNMQKKLIPHTNQFRILDKAAVLREGREAREWEVCTVTQVEEVKILTRMMPILLSTIIMNTCLAQLQTFSVQQGARMNTYIGSFNIPPASIPVIPLVFMTLLIPVYELAFVPLVRKITGHPNGITELQRVGVGLVLSAISMVIAGVVEVKRKHESIEHNHPISLFWLSFHYAIFGIADMFTLVGLLEFFYREAPEGMRSLSASFSFLSLSIGYFLSTAFVELINSVTSRLAKSKVGWLEGNDWNTIHVDFFYWFLAILSMLNFLVYLFCAKWYKYQNAVPIDREMLLKGADESLSTVTASSVSRFQDIPLNEERRESSS